MSDVGDNNFMRYVYMGQEGEVIPDGATHIFVHDSVEVVRAWNFSQHHNIVEVICHGNVEKIEVAAFDCCNSLRRVIMPGVKIVEEEAFGGCIALTDVECDKLEIVGGGAFYECESLRSINLPFARVVWRSAFCDCTALTDVKFGNKLERIEGWAFSNCNSLERITIPLKDGIIASDGAFMGCEKLNHVDLVEGVLLRETIAALQLEEWRNDMNEEIDSIIHILPTSDAGYYDHEDPDGDVEGEKAVAIRRWIRSVVGNIIEYKAQHRRLLDEDAAPTLQGVLPQDIVMNNVLPFLELP